MTTDGQGVSPRKSWGSDKCLTCDTIHAVTDICTGVATTVTDNIEVVVRGFDPVGFRSAIHQLALEVAELVVRKQHDYGHDNITRHGLEGLCVRISDKQARLHNLLNSGHKPSNETVRDTFTDLVGYGLLGLMVIDDTFQLPLSED